MCEEAGEQRVARDVEGDSESQVGGALVHLAGELAWLGVGQGVRVRVGVGV